MGNTHRDPVFDQVAGLELMEKRCDICVRQTVEDFGIVVLKGCKVKKKWPNFGRCKWQKLA